MKRTRLQSKLLRISVTLLIILAVIFNIIIYTAKYEAKVYANECDSVACSLEEVGNEPPYIQGQVDFDLSQVEYYSGREYTVVNDNKPFFLDEDLTTQSYEYYGELDKLGRCTQAYACIGKEMLPKDPRENISSVRPTGYHSVIYNQIEGGYLYNRCHLIGYQLTGQNANKRNLITGTRYLNVVGMLQFEDMVTNYIKETGNHVLYRVTPIFCEDDLVARGVLMEAKSVEDGGKGICFNIYAYNVQPGIFIHYSNGDSFAIK